MIVCFPLIISSALRHPVLILFLIQTNLVLRSCITNLKWVNERTAVNYNSILILTVFLLSISQTQLSSLLMIFSLKLIILVSINKRFLFAANFLFTFALPFITVDQGIIAILDWLFEAFLLIEELHELLRFAGLLFLSDTTFSHQGHSVRHVFRLQTA